MDDKYDLSLTQALDDFETEARDDMLLSQALEEIDKKTLMPELLSGSQLTAALGDATNLDFETFGEFDVNLELQEELHPKPNKLSDQTPLGNTKRFGSAVSFSEVTDLVSEQKSKNTTKSTRWAMSVFEAWRQTRNDEGETLPDLHGLDINEHLSRFVIEVRKQNGEEYPPSSLYNIVAGILRQFREDGVYDKNFLDEKDPRFAPFRKVLDAQMKKLTKAGLAVPQREAKPVSTEDEHVMWEKGVFGMHSVHLQYTVYFYNCKLFGLRGCDEHRDLDTCQFQIGNDENGRFVEFRGKTSKSYAGGLKQRRLEPKVIRHYEEDSDIVDYYDKYLNCVGQGCFYKRPLACTSGQARYGNQPVGVNKLSTLMKEMSREAGLKGRYTNHSGKKTCATTLYQQGVPEGEIMKRTGHRSIAGVRKYQKPSNAMLRDISNKLNPPKASATCSKVSEKSVNEEAAEGNSTQVSLPEAKPDFLGLLKSATPVFNNCTFNF